jgi:hypothetical protein
VKPRRQTESTCGLLPRREAPRLRTSSRIPRLPRGWRLKAREVARPAESSLRTAEAQRDRPGLGARDLPATGSPSAEKSSLAARSSSCRFSRLPQRLHRVLVGIQLSHPIRRYRTPSLRTAEALGRQCQAASSRVHRNLSPDSPGDRRLLARQIAQLDDAAEQSIPKRLPPDTNQQILVPLQEPLCARPRMRHLAPRADLQATRA